MADFASKCPTCYLEANESDTKCRRCGEVLKKQEEQSNVSCLTIITGAVTLLIFVFVGYLFGGWIGVAAGIFFWMVALGSIGLTKDVMDAGEAARKFKSD